MILSLIVAWYMILRPEDVRCGQSARDDKSHVAGRVCVTILLTSSNQCCRQRTLPRGPGLSPISRDVIGLVSCFGSIIIKCRPISVYGI